MVTRKGINIFGQYVVSIKAICHFIYVFKKKMKCRTESCFILFLKLNGHPTRCFNFGYVDFIPTAVSLG